MGSKAEYEAVRAEKRRQRAAHEYSADRQHSIEDDGEDVMEGLAAFFRGEATLGIETTNPGCFLVSFIRPTSTEPNHD